MVRAEQRVWFCVPLAVECFIKEWKNFGKEDFIRRNGIIMEWKNGIIKDWKNLGMEELRS